MKIFVKRDIPVLLKFKRSQAHPRGDLELMSNIDSLRVGFGFRKILEEICESGIAEVFDRRRN